MVRHAGPIPVTVVGGFLGAGKTSLLNRLLEGADGRRFGLIVNDFGDINIDERLILTRDEDMISLANGCICCSIGSNFLRALVGLVTRPDPPDHIVIEASGVANPARIASIAQADRDLSLHGVVVLIDVVNFRQQHNDPLMSDTMEGQVRAGDLLVLTKNDIASEDDLHKVEQSVREISPAARIVVSPTGDLPLNFLFDHPVREGGLLSDQEAPHHPFWTGVFVADQPCDTAMLSQALGNLPASVLRLKGHVADRGEQRHVVQWVAGRLSLSPDDGSTFPNNGKSELVYVGVGKADDETKVRAALTSAFSA